MSVDPQQVPLASLDMLPVDCQWFRDEFSDLIVRQLTPILGDEQQLPSTCKLDK